MDRDTRLRRLAFRAWHRGTREADFMIGGFFDRYGQTWSDEELAWFEALIEEQDVDIMAWAIGTLPVPAQFAGPQMDAMRQLDFINIPR
ncbi:MAG: FAD assembly factor SdhE [Blastomonas fulva]|uniref:FAD assembly factor SdhE n=1 Tax=Blastomonas fulva TaxID=1550728 RepID=UPI004033622B